jgi:glycosyltransferase involved in cell wall biosynthesis
LLAGTLEQLRSLRIPDGFEWELVVVNNNCTDETEDVLRKYAASLPLKSTFEPNQGISHARNRAVDAARGKLILWIDDDVLVDPGWMEAYVGAASQWESAAVFGGPIEVAFEVGPPEWLREGWDVFRGAYAARDFGADPVALGRRTIPFGANFAVRADVQQRYRFDVSLGRLKNEMLGGEDTGLLRRILRDGHEGRWVPEARVRHVIPPIRVSEEYLRRFFYGQGQISARRMKPGAGIRRITRKSSVIRLRALLAVARYQITRRLSHPTKWSRHLVRESMLRGIAGEMREIDRALTP